MKQSDPFYNKLYAVLHESMDRLVESCATCNVHGDILSAPDDDDYDDDLDENDDPTASPSQASDKGSAYKLLKAQIQTKGGDQDIGFLQGIINCSSNLLILHRTRELIKETHTHHTTETSNE
jgi:hypothetical protein